MDIIDENQRFWNKHYSSTDMTYPDEDVVRYLASCRRLYPGGRMLDWGCGSGRHTLAALRSGFSVTAIDYAPSCIKRARDKAEQAGLASSLTSSLIDTNDANEIKIIADESMDMVLAWGVLFLNTPECIVQQLKTVHRVLVHGGRAFCDFRTDRDWHAAGAESGSLVELSHFDDGTASRFTPLSEADLRGIISQSGLHIASFELFEFTTDNMSKRNSWWHTLLTKEA